MTALALKNHSAFDENIFYKKNPDFLLVFGDYCSFQRNLYIKFSLKFFYFKEKFKKNYADIRDTPLASIVPKKLCGYINKKYLLPSKAN